MTTYVYVAAQDDNKVSVFTMDAGTVSYTHLTLPTILLV